MPLAEALAPRFHSIAFDYRGHGDTPQPPNIEVDWNRYADDVEAVALSLTRPLPAFGHSMGGACLLMAAHRHPGCSRIGDLRASRVPTRGGTGRQRPIGARRGRSSAPVDASPRSIRLWPTLLRSLRSAQLHPGGPRRVRSPRLPRRRRRSGAPQVPARARSHDV